MEKKNKYIALTIGPIYKTINSSQRTRMTWGASFLFSFLIRELTKLLTTGKLEENDKATRPDCKIKGEVLIPYAENIENDRCKDGEGKYPDRILIHSEEGDFEKVQEAIKILIDYLAQDVSIHLSKDKEQIKADLTDCLQFYYVEKEIEAGENSLLLLYKNLEVLELRGKYLAKDENFYLFQYLFNITKNKRGEYSLLTKQAFPDKENKRFRSLIEISTYAFSKICKDEYNKLVNEQIVNKAKADFFNKSFSNKNFNDDDDQQDEFISHLRSSDSFKDIYKKPHQYFAVIYADGDNIGATLKKIGGNDESLKFFSKMLLDFNSEVVDNINDYGGAPVYIGGEDIFAFVPLTSIEIVDGKEKQVTILNLINTIDKAFEDYFTEEYAGQLGVVRPTLSFGIAVAYYKNPLNETMRTAHELLRKAKSNPDKNAIELVLEEHSGQQFQLSMKKNKKESYNAICELIEALTSKVFSKEDEEKPEKDFINSITQKLKDPLFKTLLLGVSSDYSRMDELFAHTFNEAIHKGEMKPYIDRIQKLTKLLFSDYCDDDTRINNLYSTLRLIDFMHKNPKD